MNDQTAARLLALVPDPEPCPVCTGPGAMLLTQLVGLPVLALVQCPLCASEQGACVVPTTGAA